MKKVAVSGYFDPLHSGHMKMFEEASALGEVTVIVNNTKQCLAKKGYEYIDIKERVEAVSRQKGVSQVIVSLDEDQSVNKSLLFLMPDYFVNGGDRNTANIPESTTCKSNHIKIIDGVGGEKTVSSSEINRGVRVYRDWGHYEIVKTGSDFKVKILTIFPGKRTSAQSHELRGEHLDILSGVGRMFLDGETIQIGFLRRGKAFRVPVYTEKIHQIENTGKEDLIILERQVGKCVEGDIKRFNDVL